MQRIVNDLSTGERLVVDLTPEEIAQASAAAAAHAAQLPLINIREREAREPITQRMLRETILAIAAQAGQITAAMLDPAQPLDELSPQFMALSIGIRRCVLQERAVRVERAKL